MFQEWKNYSFVVGSGENHENAKTLLRPIFWVKPLVVVIHSSQTKAFFVGESNHNKKNFYQKYYLIIWVVRRFCISMIFPRP